MSAVFEAEATKIYENGCMVKDIRGAMGFENPPAIYKWIAGRPSNVIPGRTLSQPW